LSLRAGVGHPRARGRLAHSRAQADALLAQTPLHDRAHVAARTLSYGQRRLLDLLIALAPRPALLLLDEPTAGLARSEALVAMALMRSFCAQSTILLVSHDIALVFTQCQRIAVLDQGALVAVGPPDVIRQSPAARRAYLGSLEGGEAA